ncbi:hypothetical protein FBU30_005301 [Linnemannia zychae]|nr:hypothetical protein FBU30_005301 [Linnemannia zychae]
MLSVGSTSVREINIRRLMAKCDAKLQGDRILQGLERSKYITNIKTLEEMLAELEEELSRSGRSDKDAIKRYADKIEALASAVGGISYVQPSQKGLIQTRVVMDVSQLADGRHTIQDPMKKRPSIAADLEKQQDIRPTQQIQTSIEVSSQLRERRSDRSELFGNRQSNQGVSTARSGSGNVNNNIDNGDQAQVEAALQNDRAAREEMEAGLSALMQQLRHNALAIQQTLVDEQKSGLFDEADQALDTNISRLGKERARLELYSKQSRKTKWMIWGIVLGVSITFVFMFFIIRIF